MITITRLLAKQIRSVFRKALCLAGNNPRLRVELIAGPDGLTIRCQSKGSAVEYHQLGELPAAHVVIPFDLLREVEGAKPEPVTLAATTDGQVTRSWHEGEIPRTSTVAVPDPYPDEPPFPAAPDNWLENGSELRQALHAAMETADDTSTRYALSSIQLRGSVGSIMATDGRQALIQSGFLFPFDDNVLVPRTLVFGSKELPTDVAVLVGRTEKHVAIRIGAWTFFLVTNTEARFPDFESLVPQAVDAVATMALHDADRRWLARNIGSLPAGDDGIVPITIELNGSVAIRSRRGDTQPTELILVNSRREGQEIALATDRRFLARALELGFARLHIFGQNKPVLCQDDRRTLYWAVLDPGGVVPATDNVTRVASPVAGQVRRADAFTNSDRVRRRPRSPRVSSARSRPQLEKPVSQSRSQREATDPTSSTPLEQAHQLRSALREMLDTMSTLIRSLRDQRKQDRLVRSTLASFRRLQTVS